MKRPGLAFCLWGAPGIGKTHAALALLRGAPCRSMSVHATQPLEGTVSRLPRPKKLALWLERALERLERGGSPGTETLLGTLAGLLAANAPFILHVEDLHEANDERLEFWRQLAVTVARLRGVGLLTTSRVPPPNALEVITLLALNREASDALLEAEAGAVLPQEGLAWIFQHAVGNPLFTLEYFRFLARQGTLWNDGRRWRWRTPEREFMPVTVEALIERMLQEATSTPALEAVMGAKAMLGIGGPKAVWREVSGLSPEELDGAEHQLERLGLFSAGDFAHPLYREVVLHNLTLERRRSLARRAIGAFHDEPEAAAQFVKAAELEPSAALGVLERAAQAAKNAGSELRAAGWQAQAVDYATGGQRANLAFEAGRVLEKADRSEAIRLLQIALEEQPEHADTIFWLAGCYASIGQSDEVEKLLSRISDDERAQLGWLKRQISLRFALGDYAGVLERWESRPELRDDSDPTLAYNVGFARSLRGDQMGAETIALAALEQPELSDLSRARLLTVCGLSRHYQDDQRGALSYFNDALAAAQAAKNPAFTAATLHNRSMVWERTSQPVEMLSDTEEALRLYAEVGLVRNYASTLTKKARILHEMGQYERAEECFQESRALLLQSDASNFLVTCEAEFSTLYLEWQPVSGSVLASKYAEHALRIARPMGGNKLGLSLEKCSLVATHQGNAGRGLELAQECLEFVQASGISTPWHTLNVLGLAWDKLGDTEKAKAMLNEAYSMALKSDWRVYAEKTGLEIARMTHDLERARELLAWFEHQGMLNGANIARRYFPALATPKSPASLESPSPPRLEVLGTLQIGLEGAVTPVRGRKRQELLALLLEARISGRGEVSKLELVDQLYPDADELQSNAGLRDVVYQLRLSLGDGALTTTANGYALGNLSSDVEDFLKSGDTRLWRGTYLQGLTLSSSDTVRESIYLALRTRAEALLETDPVEATRVGRLLSEADAYDLEAVRLTLTGLRAGGNHRSLSRVYEQAKVRFLEIGESLPEAWQEFLAPVGANP